MTRFEENSITKGNATLSLPQTTYNLIKENSFVNDIDFLIDVKLDP